MDVLLTLKIIVAVGTMGAGLVSLVSPETAGRFTGLRPDGGRGVSEIRAVLGGLFIGLGLAVIIFQSPGAFRTLGVGYLAIGSVRAASIFFDKAPTGSNWLSLATEVVFGILLLI